MADVTAPFGFPYPEDTDLVRDGASDIENLAEGVNDYLDGGYLYAGTVYFTSSGSFLKADPLGTGDIGLRAIRVRLVGGGGAGGGSGNTSAGQTRAGAGGGAGVYAERFILASDLSASETVTRGAGGVGVADAAGNAGAESSFAKAEAYEVFGAGGGAGGVSNKLLSPSQANPPGQATSGAGDLVSGGGGSGYGLSDASLNAAFAGMGAASFYGGGGRGQGRISDGGAGGTAAGAQGAGGGGAVSCANDASGRGGGAGANGIVIVDVFV
jgi:hypothetical protein